MVDRGLVLPPTSRIGAITPQERAAIIEASPIKGHYEQVVDRESAFERLRGRATAAPSASAPTQPTGTGSWQRPGGFPGRTMPQAPGSDAPSPRSMPRGAPGRPERGMIEKVILGDGRRQGLAEAMAKSVVRQIGSSVGRQLVRGVLGSLLR
jgi:hypothetical protein